MEHPAIIVPISLGIGFLVGLLVFWIISKVKKKTSANPPTELPTTPNISDVASDPPVSDTSSSEEKSEKISEAPPPISNLTNTSPPARHVPRITQAPPSPPVFEGIPANEIVGAYVIGREEHTFNTRYVTGRIVSYRDNIVTMNFSDRIVSRMFPDAFKRQEFLFADPDLQRKVEKLQNHVERRLPPQENSALPPPEGVIPVWVNKNYTAKMIDSGCLRISHNRFYAYGTSANDIYENGHIEFGWNALNLGTFTQGSDMCAYRATREGYHVWFITHHKYIERGPTNHRWFNIVGRKYIHEYWRMDLIDPRESENLYGDFDARVTFAKAKNGKYIYVGIFQPIPMLQHTVHNGRPVCIKVYERIGSKYPS